jgi:hypothetical protein
VTHDRASGEFSLLLIKYIYAHIRHFKNLQRSEYSTFTQVVQVNTSRIESSTAIKIILLVVIIELCCRLIKRKC